MRGAAFGALALTAAFWFWVVTGLLAVHWPNNGQEIPAGALLLAGSAILGCGLVFTILDVGSPRAQGVTSTILAGLSLASFAVILGTITYFLSLYPFFALVLAGEIPVSGLVFLLLGLKGSAVATLLYLRVRDRTQEAAKSEPPAAVVGADLAV